jgi:hypothetical protein
LDAKQHKIHFTVKLAYTVFLMVLVPKYLMDYGPSNFLYFCDVALFFALVSVWTEQPIWASAACMGILLFQVFWMADFLSMLAGKSLLGITSYMFDTGIPLFTRGLSFYHFWLPIFLLYLVFRLGYDRRAFMVWTLVTGILVPVCYFGVPLLPPGQYKLHVPVNINYVYGFGDHVPQTWMPPVLWLGMMMIGLPLLVYWPTHRLLKWKRLRLTRR